MHHNQDDGFERGLTILEYTLVRPEQSQATHQLKEGYSTQLRTLANRNIDYSYV